MSHNEGGAGVPTTPAPPNPSHEVPHQRNPSAHQKALANIDPWFADCTSRGIEHLAALGYPFNVDSLRELGITEPDAPQRWGAVIAAAAAHGTIECVGASIMWRPSGVAVATRMWRGTEEFRNQRQTGAA